MRLYISVALALLAGFQAAYGQTGAGKPNILFVMLDDQNDYTGFLGGHPQARTPHLDRLAEKAHVFEQAYCNSPLCAPSRTSMISGKHPDYTDIYRNAGEYSRYKNFRDIFTPAGGNPVVFTLPEVLKDSGGYFTANFYKIFHGWANIGFDNDYDAAAVDPCQRALSWNLFLDLNGKEDLKPDPAFGEHQEGIPSLSHSRLADQREPLMNGVIMVDSALAFLERYATNPAAYCERPFFAAVGMYRPHIPWFVAERYYAAFYDINYRSHAFRIPFNAPNDLWPPSGMMQAGEPPVEGLGYDQLCDLGKRIAASGAYTWDVIAHYADSLSQQAGFLPGVDTANKRDVLFQAIRANATMAYLASSSYADAQFGRLWEGLQAYPQLADNTIVIMVADHGYSMGERRHFHKASLWETDLRIPMLIYDPRIPGNGKRISSTVSLLDVMPTVLDLAGVPYPTMPSGLPYLDGYSLVPLMETPAKELQRPVNSGIRFTADSTDEAYGVQNSVRDQRYHYIRYYMPLAPDTTGPREELYEIGPDRRVDPEEWYNLSKDTAYAATKAHLAQWLPEGPLFNQAMPSVRMQVTTPFCALSTNDTLRLQAVQTDIWGKPEPPDTAQYRFRWTLHPGTVQAWGPEAVFSLSHLDTSVQRIVLHLAAWLREDSAYFLSDTRRFGFGGPFQPDFDVQLEGRQVRVTEYSMPPNPGPGLWDYGDGMKRFQVHPQAHQFSAPGSYLMTRIQAHGSEAQCQDTAYRHLFLADSVFDVDACISPTNVRLDSVSSMQARVLWSQTPGATSYAVAYRDLDGGLFAPWTYSTTDTGGILLDNLPVAGRIQLKVSSVCPDSAGGYSWPIDWRSPDCAPPTNLSLSLDSAQFSIAWTPSLDPGLAKTGLRLVIDDTLTLQRKVPASVHMVHRDTPLPKGTQYLLKAASFCAQIDGSLRQGPRVASLLHVLPASPEARAPNHHVRLRVFPNPAEHMVHVEWPGPGEWCLMDALGRCRLSGSVQSEHVGALPLQALGRGVYRLHWIGPQEARSAVLVLADVQGMP